LRLWIVVAARGTVWAVRCVTSVTGNTNDEGALHRIRDAGAINESALGLSRGLHARAAHQMKDLPPIAQEIIGKRSGGDSAAAPPPST